MEQISIPDMPFSILALAPFSTGTAHELFTVEPIDIDQALAAVVPSFFISLSNEDCPAGGIQLQFQRMRDFTPDGLMESQPYLKSLLEADHFCQEAETQKKSSQDILAGLKQWPELPLISIAHEKTVAKEEKSSLDNLLSMVDVPGSESSTQEDLTGKPESYAALACKILDTIYTDPMFRSLESCWQGLRFLGRYLAKAGGSLSILSVSPDKLEESFGEIRNEILTNPPSLLLVDQDFTSSQRSIESLDKLAQFGQEMLVPTLAWIDNSFFQIDDWEELDQLSFLPNYLEGASFAKYRNFQQSDSGRWLGLACNRFLTRFPYGPENRSRILPFKEKNHPWLSPVWAVAALMASRVKQTGWPAGMASSGQHLLEDLALASEGSVEQSPLEIQLSKSRLDQLARCGIMSLSALKKTDSAFLAGDVMVSTDISLSYQMLVSRVSHFVLWCRDNWQDSFQEDELADRLGTAFQLFSEKQGTSSTGNVTVDCHHDGEAIQVSFCWLPSRQIFSAGQEIVLKFAW